MYGTTFGGQDFGDFTRDGNLANDILKNACVTLRSANA